MNGTNGTVSQKALTGLRKFELAGNHWRCVQLLVKSYLPYFERPPGDIPRTHGAPNPVIVTTLSRRSAVKKRCGRQVSDHVRIYACGCRPRTSWSYAQVTAIVLQINRAFSQCCAEKPPPWCHPTAPHQSQLFWRSRRCCTLCSLDIVSCAG